MNIFEKKIVNNLREKSCFTKEDLKDNYKNHGLFISDDALNVKIFRWRKKGLIHNVAKGKYVINTKSSFVPVSDKFIRKMHKLFISRFEDVDYCIWATAWLSNFMHHIPFKSFYIMETEKDVCESVFYYLRDNGINVYYEIDAKQIEKYVLPEDDSVIIRPLITRAPCKNHEETRYASIEKILVDIFCDQDIFYLYSGREQQWIFENILKAYNINFSSLLTYAERRKRDKELKSYLLNNFSSLVKDIIE